MFHSEDRYLDEQIRCWTHQPDSDPEFNRKVRERIHQRYFNRTTSGGVFPLPQPRRKSLLPTLVSTLAATMMILAFVGLVRTPSSDPERPEFPEIYQQFIRPADSALALFSDNRGFDFVHPSADLSSQTLEQTLDWIEKNVGLEKKQVARFDAIHREYLNAFTQHFSEMIRLENEYRSFERARIAGEDIDLLSVHQNLKAQKAIYRETFLIQQNFIDQVFTILSKNQREKYDQLIHPNTPNPRI